MKSLRDSCWHSVYVYIIACLITLFSLYGMPQRALAVPYELLFRYKHHLFSLEPRHFPEWYTLQEIWTYRGKEISPPAFLRVDGDTVPPLPVGFERFDRFTWDTVAIARTIHDRIATELDRPAGSVIIGRDDDGNITFDGVGMPGRRLDIEKAVLLTIDALDQDIFDIVLPVEELPPDMTVTDSDLRKQGISEVVGFGESDFSGSPLSRRHNISVGLSKFNGSLISQGEQFSFNGTLGPVNAASGYKKELVILGDKTLPDFGGGLCQVSTTAYRGVWEYGFPIDQRRNHSFTVLYYSPHGTDATIYPPHTDVKFTNDSPGSLLIQTHAEDSKAYFIYYGTSDGRETEIIGPYTWGHRDPPPDKTEFTTDIPPGTTKKVGGRVPGIRAAWFRAIRLPGEDEESIESVYSIYEARPLFYQVGIEQKVLEEKTEMIEERKELEEKRRERRIRGLD
jgi:vancomycin resistance protein YoaR